MSSSVKIFISGYPLTLDEMGLAQLVGPYGEIATIKIVRDKATRRPKGYAFIELATPAAAEEVAAALNGVEFQDNVLTVNIVEEKAAPHAQAKLQQAPYARAPRKTKRPRLPR